MQLPNQVARDARARDVHRQMEVRVHARRLTRVVLRGETTDGPVSDQTSAPVMLKRAAWHPSRIGERDELELRRGMWTFERAERREAASPPMSRDLTCARARGRHRCHSDDGCGDCTQEHDLNSRTATDTTSEVTCSDGGLAASSSCRSNRQTPLPQSPPKRGTSRSRAPRQRRSRCQENGLFKPFSTCSSFRPKPGSARTRDWWAELLGGRFDHDQLVRRNVRNACLATVREAHDELTHRRRRPEPEVHAGILGGEIATPRSNLPIEPPAPRKHGGDRRSRMESLHGDLEPVAAGTGVPQQHERAADRIDGDVDVAVVVVIGRCEPTTDDQRQRALVDDPTRLRELPGRPSPARFWRTWMGCASLARFVTGMSPFVRIRSRLPSRSRSTYDAPHPAKLVPRAEAKPARASANADPAFAVERLRKTAWVCPREFVTKRSALPSSV